MVLTRPHAPGLETRHLGEASADSPMPLIAAPGGTVGARPPRRLSAVPQRWWTRALTAIGARWPPAAAEPKSRIHSPLVIGPVPPARHSAELRRVTETTTGAVTLRQPTTTAWLPGSG